jgi:hypothetical protein
MASFIDPQNGDLATAEHVAQLVEDFQGLRNVPLSVTGINDAASYALTLKNAGTNSRGLIVYAADGSTVLLQVDGSGVLASAAGGPAGGIVTNTPGSITNAMLGADVARDNLLVNGSMAVAQRGNGPFNTNTAYTADRWQIALGAGSTISVSCASAGIGAGGGATVPCVQGSYTHSTASYLLQQVKFAGDGNHVGHLGGQTVSLSMRVWANAANAVRISLSTDGTGPLNAVSSFHPGNAAPATLTVSGLVPNDATVLNVELNFQATCSQWYAGQAMLVVGSQAANYVPMHPADDLARCKRYYKVPFLAAGDMTWNGYGPAGASCTWTFPMDIEMAVAPTITKNGPAWFASNCAQPTFAGNAKILNITTTITALGFMVFQNSGGSGQTLTMEANP